MISLIEKRTGHFKSFDGTRIYYEMRGKGPPVFLHYGIGCLMNHWIHQIKYFSSHYTVVTYDYRAHHQSEIPENHENISVDSLARDVVALMDHLEIQSASHWGHSFGAQVLVRTFDVSPARFQNLILVNGFVKNPLDQMFGNNLASKFFSSFKNGYQLLPETLGFLWRSMITNPLAVHASALAGGFNLNLTSLKDIEIYSRGIAFMNLSAFISLFESMMNYDGSPVLDRINVPTLIISGSKDTVTPIKHQHELYERIPSAQFLEVPYGSHCTQLDMPELVNLKIQKFLVDNAYQK